MANIRDFRNTLIHKIVNGVENADLLRGLIDFDRMTEDMVHINSHVWEHKSIRCFRIVCDTDGGLWIELNTAPDPAGTIDLPRQYDDYEFYPEWIYDHEKKQWKDGEHDWCLPSNLFTAVFTALQTSENVKPIDCPSAHLISWAKKSWSNIVKYHSIQDFFFLPMTSKIDTDTVKYHTSVESLMAARVFDWISIYDAPMHFDHALHAMIQRILLNHPLLTETDLDWTAYVMHADFQPSSAPAGLITGKYPTHNDVWNFAMAALDVPKGWYDQEVGE